MKHTLILTALILAMSVTALANDLHISATGNLTVDRSGISCARVNEKSVRCNLSPRQVTRVTFRTHKRSEPCAVGVIYKKAGQHDWDIEPYNCSYRWKNRNTVEVSQP